MAKTSTLYVCTDCGAASLKWSGKCGECGSWNTLEEEERAAEGAHTRPAISPGAEPVPVTDGSIAPPARIMSGIAEFDRVLGGGLVPGSLALVGGDPGIG